MPTTGLHAYALRKEWRWNTDEITDGIAATHQDITELGTEPVPAFILGHDVAPDDGAREQLVAVGAIRRTADDDVHWVGDVAPVFIGVRLGGGRFKLVCVGMVLPGDRDHPVATFDRIRRALCALGAGESHAAFMPSAQRRIGPQNGTCGSGPPGLRFAGVQVGAVVATTPLSTRHTIRCTPGSAHRVTKRRSESGHRGHPCRTGACRAAS